MGVAIRVGVGAARAALMSIVARMIGVGLTAGDVAVGTGPVGTAAGRGRVPVDVGVGADDTSDGPLAMHDTARSAIMPASASKCGSRLMPCPSVNMLVR